MEYMKQERTALLRQHTFIDLIINKVFSCVQHIWNVNRSDCNSRLNLNEFDFVPSRRHIVFPTINSYDGSKFRRATRGIQGEPDSGTDSSVRYIK